MADRYWKGGAGATDNDKGDFNAAANWQTAAGGAGAVPLPADLIHFDKRAGIVSGAGSKHTAGNHWNCYHNMANGPDDCQGLYVTPDFTGRIGMDAEDTIAPLQVSLAALKQLRFRGNEQCHIKIKTANKVVPALIHNTVSGLLGISGVNDVNAIWTKIECVGGGTLDVADDTKVTELHSHGTSIVSIHESCPAMKILANGGSIYCDSPLGEVTNCGASIVLGNTTLAVAQAAIDIASLFNTSGNFTWRAGGKMTDCSQRGGNIFVVGDGDKVIGNAGEVFLLMGGVFDASGQYGKLTAGGAAKILITGGSVILPSSFRIDTWSI